MPYLFYITLYLIFLGVSCLNGMLPLFVCSFIIIPLYYSLQLDNDATLAWALPKRLQQKQPIRGKRVLSLFIHAAVILTILHLSIAVFDASGFFQADIFSRTNFPRSIFFLCLYLASLMNLALMLLLTHFWFILRLSVCLVTSVLSFAFVCTIMDDKTLFYFQFALYFYLIPTCLWMAARGVQHVSSWRLYLQPSLLLLVYCAILYRWSCTLGGIKYYFTSILFLLILFQHLELMLADERFITRNSLKTLGASLLISTLAALGMLTLSDSAHPESQSITTLYQGLGLIYTVNIALLIWRTIRLMTKEFISTTIFAILLVTFWLLLVFLCAGIDGLPLLPLFCLSDDVAPYASSIRYDYFAGMLLLTSCIIAINIVLTKQRVKRLAQQTTDQ